MDGEISYGETHWTGKCLTGKWLRGNGRRGSVHESKLIPSIIQRPPKTYCTEERHPLTLPFFYIIVLNVRLSTKIVISELLINIK